MPSDGIAMRWEQPITLEDSHQKSHADCTGLGQGQETDFCPQTIAMWAHVSCLGTPDPVICECSQV